MPEPGITELLRRFREGDREAEGQLFQLVHQELKQIARSKLKGERQGHTLVPTALVNEAYERLVRQRARDWQSKAHFLAVASTIMRQLLIDYARKRKSEKRGEGIDFASLSESGVGSETGLDTYLAVHEALEALAELDERQARVVSLTFFGGMTQEQIAEVMELDVRTIKRDWKTARLWLKRRLEPSRAAGSGIA